MILQHPIPTLLSRINAGLGQRFGENPAMYAPLGLNGHDGIDYPAALGTPVYAAHDGYLAYANQDDPRPGLGIKQWFIEDGIGYELAYWHFEDTPFKDSAYSLTGTSILIKNGDLVGHVDSTGFSTGNHLHFGLRLFDPNTRQILNYDNGYKGSIDPLPFIQHDMPIVFKKAGDATLYVELFGHLVPFGMDWNKFLTQFGQPIVIELTEAQFNQMRPLAGDKAKFV